MQLLAAEVTKKARTVETKYGTRTVFDCVCDHREVTIWRKGNDPYALSLTPNQKVTLSRDSAGKYNLVEGIEPLPPETPTNPADIGQNGRSDEIRLYTEKLAKLYAHCYRQASKEMGGFIADEEGLRAIASCLFIQTTKHFNL